MIDYTKYVCTDTRLSLRFVNPFLSKELRQCFETPVVEPLLDSIEPHMKMKKQRNDKVDVRDFGFNKQEMF